MLALIHRVHAQRPSFQLATAFAIVFVVLAIDIVWLGHSSFEFREHTLRRTAVFAVLAAVLLPFVRRDSLRTLFKGYLLLTVAWPALRLFNHLTFAISGDYVDAALSNLDDLLGIDWIAYATWLDHHPAFTLLIAQAYGSLTPLSIAVFVAAAFVCPKKVSEEYLLLFVILAVTVSVIGIFFPAYGPMVYFEDLTSHFRYLAQAGHVHVGLYDAYKAGTQQVMQLEGLMGLTTFPSFHTAMGCLMIYTSRQSLLLLTVSTIYAAMMISGAVVFGSHYFVDILAGLAITILAILAVRAVPRLRQGLSYGREPRVDPVPL